MEISKHGHLRVINRTRMCVDDVLSLVKSGMVVSLGFNDGYEFLLFYSPFDNGGKIAVVSAERTLLISVWETDYCLPDGVVIPTRDMIKDARTLLNSFLFSKLGGNTKIFDLNEILSVKVQVILGEEILQEFNLSSVTRRKSKDLKCIIDSSTEELKRIVLANEDSDIPLRELTYYMLIFNPDTPNSIERTHSIKHSTLADRFLLIEVMVLVRIQVVILGEVQYEYKDLQITRSKSKTFDDLISCLRGDFQSLVEAVASCEVSLDDVRYKINFINSKTLLPSVDPLVVRHANFVRLLSA